MYEKNEKLRNNLYISIHILCHMLKMHLRSILSSLMFIQPNWSLPVQNEVDLEIPTPVHAVKSKNQA